MSVVQHDTQTNFLISTQNGSIKQTNLSLVLGDWDTVQKKDVLSIGYDINVQMLTAVNIFSSLVVLAWLDGNTHRIAIFPSADDKLYDPNTPYRLYYATDTRKLYQNIADTWQFVATQDHTNLLNAGNMTHDEIDETLSKLTRFKEVQW